MNIRIKVYHLPAHRIVVLDVFRIELIVVSLACWHFDSFTVTESLFSNEGDELHHFSM